MIVILILCHNLSKPLWSHYEFWTHILSNISIVQTFLFILSTQLKSLSKSSSSSIVISCFVKDSLSSLLGTGNVTAKCYFSYVTYLWSFLYWFPLFFLFTDTPSHGPFLLCFLFLVAHHPVITHSFLGMSLPGKKWTFVLCFASSTWLLSGEAEATHLCRRLFFKSFPHHKGGDTFASQAMLFSENIAHTISNKSIELHTSDYFPPLIIMSYLETEKDFASHRMPKVASAGRWLVQCNTEWTFPSCLH